MTGSRCLQCGAQLAVFRKLTGGGDFCSDAHRQTYQEELNRVALSRLIKARPRQEEPPPPANARVTAHSAPAQPAEPVEPAFSGFIFTQFSGRVMSGQLLCSEEPLPVPERLSYPEPALAPEPVMSETTASLPLNPHTPVPPLAQSISGISVAMRLTEPELWSDFAPAEFSGPELHLGYLSETVLLTTDFPFQEEENAKESVPPRTTLPREIVIRTLILPQAELAQNLEAIPLAPFRPQMPHLEMLPLRPAITLAPSPKPAAKPAVQPRPKNLAPQPVTKAPTPAVPRERSLERKEEKPPDTLVEPSTQKSAAEKAPEPLIAGATLTLGMPGSDMGSPLFRFWYSTPAKVKVAVVLGLLTIVIFSASFKNAGKPKLSPAAGLAANAPAAGFAGGSIAMGGGGWITEWAGDPSGSRRGKQLSLYTPSMPLRDYRTEFVGQIETGSLGWVFRAKDSKNYYGMKIRIVRPGIEPGIVLTRYAVVDGIEGPGMDVPLDLTVRNDTIYKVRVEVQGARFTTSIQGKLVDIWSDGRLKSGGFGFSNERSERAHIKSVSVSF